MEIFSKGDYRPVPPEFRMLGILSLNELTKFQEKFGIYDTDTTINSIRDAIVSNYLQFDLLNFGKHGFDAKRSNEEHFLEVKQCSLSSGRLGGTWNDTNEEKALAFSDPRLYTVVAIWKGASDLQCMIYGQHAGLGQYLHERVTLRKPGSRSTQNIGIDKLIKAYGFSVIAPPDKTKEFVLTLLINYQRPLARHVNIQDIKTINDLS
jgi:hypothetical protein